jgi:CBS domain-containing protein
MTRHAILRTQKSYAAAKSGLPVQRLDLALATLERTTLLRKTLTASGRNRDLLLTVLTAAARHNCLALSALCQAAGKDEEKAGSLLNAPFRLRPLSGGLLSVFRSKRRPRANFGSIPFEDKPILNMQLNRIMTEYVEVIAPEMSIQEAAEQMRALDVGVLPVWSGDRVVGIVTDRDLAVRAVADGRDPKSTTVEEIMTRQIAYCFEDQDIEEAERVMEKNQIRRLPVLDHDNRIVGIVSLGDLAIKDDENRAGVTLERVSEHSRSA